MLMSLSQKMKEAKSDVKLSEVASFEKVVRICGKSFNRFGDRKQMDSGCRTQLHPSFKNNRSDRSQVSP